MPAVQICKGFKVRTGLGVLGSPMRGYGGSSLLEFTHNRWSLTQPWKRESPLNPKKSTFLVLDTISLALCLQPPLNFGFHIEPYCTYCLS